MCAKCQNNANDKEMIGPLYSYDEPSDQKAFTPPSKSIIPINLNKRFITSQFSQRNYSSRNSSTSMSSIPMDKYKGILIKDMHILPPTETNFDRLLQECLSIWQNKGVRSVQIFFKPPKLHLMNVASAHGFYFHHASAAENYVLMCKWIDPEVENRLPDYANHYVGVGGAVINDK